MNKILIAGRGEIARRIIRSAKELGLATVAVFDEKDRGAGYTVLADEAVFLPGANLSATYLSMSAILNAAAITGADAIHPGYGFLSENADFAEAVMNSGLTWIGPSPKTIRLMGDKALAKNTLAVHGVPMVPGYQGQDQSLATMAEVANKIGYPIMLKAAMGGGGRGIRIVSDPRQLAEAMESARREAMAAFGNDSIMIEKQIVGARHVEVQIIGDAHGGIVCLGERDCSIQRRQQKVIEEGPAPFLSEKVRLRLAHLAKLAGKASSYVSAGTVEFLVDRSEEIYFLEMNTRIQVEHPVTEMITGIDIVAEQIRTAQGKPLSFVESEIKISGHAIECRIYSEDPFQGFLPQTGTLETLSWPVSPKVRIDHDLAAHKKLRSDLDPMLAKLIVHGTTRDEARHLMVQALRDTALLGVLHNSEYLEGIVKSQWFAEGDFHTKTLDFIDPKQDGLVTDALIAAVCLEWGEPPEFWHLRNSLATRSPFSLSIKGQKFVGTLSVIRRSPFTYLANLKEGAFEIVLEYGCSDSLRVLLNGKPHRVQYLKTSQGVWLKRLSREVQVVNHLYDRPEVQSEAHSGHLRAPMAGAITKVLVSDQQMANAGETLLILEAMKMEHEIRAPFAGLVSAIHVVAGQQVRLNQPMMEITAPS